MGNGTSVKASGIPIMRLMGNTLDVAVITEMFNEAVLKKEIDYVKYMEFGAGAGTETPFSLNTQAMILNALRSV